MSKPRDIIRNRRGSIPKELDDRVKTNRAIKRSIRSSLEGSDTDLSKAETIPEISKDTGIPTEIINYHLASMKKYGTAFETTNRDGQYFKWALIKKETKKSKKKDSGAD
ncbi:MAG: hypothetical protein ACTSR2_12110 [Candidatus Hodarchaeales archaeon]